MDLGADILQKRRSASLARVTINRTEAAMLTRKSLLAALLATGASFTVATAHAQFASVFVPELAAIDNALCRPRGTNPSPLVRLAQAAGNEKPRKTSEISPAAPSAAKSVATGGPTDEPVLMSGLGNATLKVTTSSKLAQQFFDQGYRLAWGFNHDEARRAFRKAQQLDPQCAMCFWGEAWVLGPNINSPMDVKAYPPAVEAMQSAQRLAARATPREQALIDALAKRYQPEAPADRAPLDNAYADAMRAVASRFPKDAEVATLYADALMNVAPWDYWESGGRQLRPKVADLVPTLERVLKRNPDHAGAIHLYIHAVEASDNPKRAEPHADRLAKLTPSAGHLVHMPSHIYFVLGRYKDSLALNMRAVQVDEAYIQAHKPSGVYPLGYYPHNVHFVMVSAQMGGDGKAVLASAGKLAGLIPAEVAAEALMLQPIKAAPYFAHAQFADAETIMKLPQPEKNLPYIEAAWRYARGTALAQRNDGQGARRELAEIERILQSTDYKPFDAWKIPAREVTQIAAHVLRARIAQAAKDYDTAVRELEVAIKLQDALPYMEPAYWYYPVRQTLGAVILMKGDTRAARDAFGESLTRTPNNAWALYGLQQAYAREGKKREAKAVEARFRSAWSGGNESIDLERL
jgi:tetratricopeptide (TPR) repeat protein